MNGSKNPEKSTDKQCKHCGLWFSRRGHIPHERNCPWQDRDEPLQPIDDQGAGVSSDGGDPEGATPTDGVAGGASPDGGETGLGLGGPPDAPESDDDLEDVDDGDDTEDCPSCGSDLGATEDEIAEMHKPTCTECGTRVTVK